MRPLPLSNMMRAKRSNLFADLESRIKALLVYSVYIRTIQIDDQCGCTDKERTIYGVGRLREGWLYTISL